MFDFNANQEVETLDGVPEDYRSFYKEVEGGKHKLDTENPIVKSSISNLSKLNQSLKAARAEAAGLKGKSVDLSALGEYGDSPETILQNFQAKLEESQAAAKANGDQDLQRQIEKIKQDLAKTHSTDIEKKEKRIGALQGQLYDKLVSSEAKTALSSAGAIDVDLALPFVERQIKVVEQDGTFGVTVVDAAGDVRYSGVTGAPMTVTELVSEIKANDKYGPLFKSEAPNGGGTNPGGPGRIVNRSTNPAEMTSTQKIAAGLSKGQHSAPRR